MASINAAKHQGQNKFFSNTNRDLMHNQQRQPDKAKHSQNSAFASWNRPVQPVAPNQSASVAMNNFMPVFRNLTLDNPGKKMEFTNSAGPDANAHSQMFFSTKYGSGASKPEGVDADNKVTTYG